jgi:hypothetical protein
MVHLRRDEARNLARCTRLWELGHGDFPGGSPFARRISVGEEGARLPGVSLFRGEDQYLYSHSGALEDESAIKPGENLIVMGGGALDHNLAKAFESLVRIKLEQGEKLEVVIPLFMTYCSRDLVDAEEYIGRDDNKYVKALETRFENGELTGYATFIDNVPGACRFPVDPQVRLNWFTTLKAMFQSRFFPELNGQPKTLSRLTTYFADRT